MKQSWKILIKFQKKKKKFNEKCRTNLANLKSKILLYTELRSEIL